MTQKIPTSASEPGITTQYLPPSPPCREVHDGQARDAEATVFDNTQATLAMSKPLAQVIRKIPGGLASLALTNDDNMSKSLCIP